MNQREDEIMAGALPVRHHPILMSTDDGGTEDDQSGDGRHRAARLEDEHSPSWLTARLRRSVDHLPVGEERSGGEEQGAGPRPGAGLSVTGDDRFVGDYLRSELLDRVSPTEVAFLTRTSILDRMCGDLCDAVLSRTGSSRALEQLESRNLLVVPLGWRREWYRYHNLFRELLQRSAIARMHELGLLPHN